MPIFTSSFARVKLFPPDLRPVSIARWPPRTWRGERCYALAPAAALLKRGKAGALQEGEYIREFNAQLAALDAAAIAREMQGASLCCFEAPGFFCHRRLVAEWLESALSIEVPEWGFPRNLLPPAWEMPAPDAPPEAFPWYERCSKCRKEVQCMLGDEAILCPKCGTRTECRWPPAIF